ncbi:hypothetical protein A6F53_08105 [Levilactobacillus brevis]|jgi:hypothetical protein|uniref:hypothetical protein n=1 Tax=Levilactobacillus brevis TaxID=1580 RepID=UPI000465E944|nr:hypothetical protein [Levilactobacillus brevis]DAP36985.1 MAG TPA: hypothetical protein [Caudoviricetes sp.]ANN49209.1 hypothetical protein A6F53_08105 [Levilactobacillus brevis]ATU69057.1 hypothetical protein CT113_01400 [Levilactobacillus brevis]MCT2886860.1 hypothetical protein [Levilactobacillus brevis]MCT3574190.1 hypothetical protein [Levilactobacillus brevis]
MAMNVPDHATFDFVRYMNRLESQPETGFMVKDTNGDPMISDETYWEAEGRYVPTDEDSMHDFLDAEGEDYGTQIDWDYDHLATILEDFKSAEVISWT